jgi:hypothetical protein
MEDEADRTAVEMILGGWHNKCRRNRTANYLAANAYSRKHVKFGVVAVSLSAIVGTGVFASLGKQVNPTIQILVGGMSVAAAVLAALQTFLKHGDRASSHRQAAARYGALVRQIETLLATSKNILSTEVLDELRTKMDKLAQETPQLPEHIWKRSLKEVPPAEEDFKFES